MITTRRILKALAVGPATADELALDLGGNARLVSAVLHSLKDQKRVHARRYYTSGDRKQSGVKMLYSLPEHRL